MPMVTRAGIVQQRCESTKNSKRGCSKVKGAGRAPKNAGLHKGLRQHASTIAVEAYRKRRLRSIGERVPRMQGCNQ
jgi:hypothetical protein